jgi:predicted  nucleic acid-binding Zn-ribbon protein
MPILRCPNCYYATTVRQDSIDGVKCYRCGNNLFDYYYKDRSASEAASLISKKGVELKKKKAKSERASKKQQYSDNMSRSAKAHSETGGQKMSSKESLTESVVGYAIAGAILLAIYGGFQYFQLRSGIQESTIEILNDNGYPGYKADGITLPLSAAFGGITTAKVFLDGNGKETAIEVEITQKGIPVLSIFTGGEYLTEIAGIELMRLGQ